jgi:ABC-type dipeptide/oligopeptide/nickel transport system permease component
MANAGRWLLVTVPALLVNRVFVFAIIHLAPGDPVQAALGWSYTPSAVHALRHQMGLNQPRIDYVTHLVGAMGSQANSRPDAGVPSNADASQ